MLPLVTLLIDTKYGMSCVMDGALDMSSRCDLPHCPRCPVSLSLTQLISNGESYAQSTSSPIIHQVSPADASSTSSPIFCHCGILWRTAELHDLREDVMRFQFGSLQPVLWEGSPAGDLHVNLKAACHASLM